MSHPYRSPPEDLILRAPHELYCFARLPAMANDCICGEAERWQGPVAPDPAPVPTPVDKRSVAVAVTWFGLLIVCLASGNHPMVCGATMLLLSLSICHAGP